MQATKLGVGKCPNCDRENVMLKQTLFRTIVPCACCSPLHFEAVTHCAECTPEPPTVVTLKIDYATIVSHNNFHKEVQRRMTLNA